jgi:hypothetical protein
MIPFIVGIGLSIATLGIPPKVGTEAWCALDKNDGSVQCYYKTKQECEDYRQPDEKCVKNPEPNKEY